MQEPELVPIEEFEDRVGYPSYFMGVWHAESDPVELDFKHTERLNSFFNSEDSDAFGFGFHGVKVYARNGRLVIDNISRLCTLFYDVGIFCKMLSKAMTQGDILFEFLCVDGTHWGMRISPGKVEGVIFEERR